MFCEKCGGLMFPKEGVHTCSKCGHTKKIKAEDQQSIMKMKKEDLGTAFFDGQGTLPKDKVLCEQCGNNEAYYVIRQMRAADEPETMIYQCTKCGYKWRKYG
jgi:DNA-directed RNA polymerase subunit M